MPRTQSTTLRDHAAALVAVADGRIPPPPNKRHALHHLSPVLDFVNGHVRTGDFYYFIFCEGGVLNFEPPGGPVSSASANLLTMVYSNAYMRRPPRDARDICDPYLAGKLVSQWNKGSADALLIQLHRGALKALDLAVSRAQRACPENFEANGRWPIDVHTTASYLPTLFDLQDAIYLPVKELADACFERPIMHDGDRKVPFWPLARCPAPRCGKFFFRPLRNKRACSRSCKDRLVYAARTDASRGHITPTRST